jgi:hypothetical protein
MKPKHVIACCEHLISVNQKIIDKNDAWLKSELVDFEIKKSRSFFMKLLNWKYNYAHYNYDQGTDAAQHAAYRNKEYTQILQHAVYFQKCGVEWLPDVPDLVGFHRKFYKYCTDNSIPY